MNVQLGKGIKIKDISGGAVRAKDEVSAWACKGRRCDRKDQYDACESLHTSKSAKRTGREEEIFFGAEPNREIRRAQVQKSFFWFLNFQYLSYPISVDSFLNRATCHETHQKPL